ncbi:MAG: SRPBCC family protein [Actinomycetota bacterium]|nr:SRPBCC family protein [Actinomycetota bacterium]
MAVNRAILTAPPGAVFAVLSDPGTYADFVVGTKRIRRFEPTWPEVGSVFHHTLGVGPFILRDLTRVVEVEEGRRLVLRAHMGPLCVNRVAFSLHPAGQGTEVEVEEHAVDGPLAKLWNAAFDAVMRLRNAVMLRRLDTVAARRWERQSRAHPR